MWVIVPRNWCKPINLLRAAEQDNTNQTITNQFVGDTPTDHIMVLSVITLRTPKHHPRSVSAPQRCDVPDAPRVPRSPQRHPPRPSHYRRSTGHRDLRLKRERPRVEGKTLWISRYPQSDGYDLWGQTVFFCDESLNLHDFDDVFVDVTYVLLSLLLPQKNTCRHLPLKNAPKEGRALMGETELSTGSVLRSRNRFQVIRGSEKKKSSLVLVNFVNSSLHQVDLCWRKKFEISWVFFTFIPWAISYTIKITFHETCWTYNSNFVLDTKYSCKSDDSLQNLQKKQLPRPPTQPQLAGTCPHLYNLSSPLGPRSDLLPLPKSGWCLKMPTWSARRTCTHACLGVLGWA